MVLPSYSPNIPSINNHDGHLFWKRKRSKLNQKNKKNNKYHTLLSFSLYLWTTVFQRRRKRNRRIILLSFVAFVGACCASFQLSPTSFSSHHGHDDPRKLDPITSHRWPNATIAIDPLLRELEIINRKAGHGDVDIPGAVVPYLIRDGKLYHSLTIAKRSKQHANNRRIQAFEEMANMALSMARENSNNNNSIFVTDALLTKKQDVPLLFVYGDYYKCNTDNNNNVPLFSWSVISDATLCNASFPIPGYNLWKDHKCKQSIHDWEALHNQYNLYSYPWNRKIRKAVWRGAPTGQVHRKDQKVSSSWKDKPRSKLVKNGVEHPELFDVAFHEITSDIQTIQERAEIVNSPGYLKPKMHSEHFMKYMAIIDIDGNSWSSRFGSLLCMNSVVIKVQPSFSNWFDHSLHPWKHYIPVNANLSDLVEKVTYAISKENESKVKAIVNNANEWCSKRIRQEAMAMDFLQTIVSYSNLLMGKDGMHELQKKEKEEEGNDEAIATTKTRISNSFSNLDMVPLAPSRSRKCHFCDKIVCSFEKVISQMRSFT